jgi:hypothetical protein
MFDPGFRQYRPITHGEFIVMAADCSAGGSDYNAAVFISKTKIDVPLIYHAKGIATNMTNAIFPVLEKIYDVTGIKPTIAYEVNAGGVFELDRLSVLNRLGKYDIYLQTGFGRVTNDVTSRIGWSTNAATRPKMLADLKDVIKNKLLRIYDKEMIDEMFSFIINKAGKPIAENNSHDDLLMALAIAWQLYQTEDKRLRAKTGGVPYFERKWGVDGKRYP